MKNYFAQNLKYLRTKYNLTQEQLANKINSTRSTVNNWENEISEPNLDMIRKLTETFNVKDNIVFEDLKSKYNTSFVDLEEDTINIPVLGRIPAGIPFEAIEDVIKYIDIPKEWTYGNKEYFGLLIDGNSMFPKYQNEDIVIFQKCEDPIKCNNKDCAVMVNGNDATFKKFIFNNNGVILQPYNMEYETKSFTPEEIQRLPVKLVGFAVQIRRDL
nr:MAG TPA: Repressor protein CI [Caudoviricetes sp.]